MPSGRIGLATKSRIQDLSLSESDIEKIHELYTALEIAVEALESSRPWLNEFARRVANGDAHLPDLMTSFFTIAADPLPGLLPPDSSQDFVSGLDWSEKEFTVQTLRSRPELSERSVRTLQRYFVRLQRLGVVQSRTKGRWGERGSRPSNYGRTAYHYRLNPLAGASAATNDEVQRMDRDFLSLAEKFLARSPAYRELLARALSVIFELASNPDFLSILWQIPGLKGLFEETDVGMIERIGKQLSLVIPVELVPISLVRQRLAVIGDTLCWDEAKRLRLEIDLG